MDTITTTNLVLKRLQPTDPESWALWPEFERRIRGALARFASRTSPEAMCVFLRDLFVNKPLLLGAWLGGTPGPSGEGNGRQGPQTFETTVGHAVAWVTVNFGRPVILMHQVVADPGVDVGSLRAPLLQALGEWAEALDQVYEKAHLSQRIDAIEWFTDRPEAWLRSFRRGPGSPVRGRTLIELPLRD